VIKYIAFSAEDALIQKAKKRAAQENKTLNAVFQGWLGGYAQKEDSAEEYNALMDSLAHVDSGGPFTRNVYIDWPSDQGEDQLCIF